MMQPTENKPVNKIWTYLSLFIGYLLIAISTWGISRSPKDWIIIQLITAFIFVLGIVIGEYTKKKNISVLYSLMLFPALAYPYVHFVNLCLTLPINYMTIYGSCAGTAIVILFDNMRKRKITKLAVVSVILFYILIGYITYRI